MGIKTFAFVVAATLLAFGMSAVAQERTGAQRDWYAGGQWYGGGGINTNSLSTFDDSVGFQVFGGYEFTNLDLGPATLAAEFGWFTSGDFDRQLEPGVTQSVDADGLWATGVLSYPLAERFHVLGRLGMDFGDDDGMMLGGGVAYRFNPNVDIRGEYVARDNINSLQANLVVRFNQR
jgi:hypothetical protein